MKQSKRCNLSWKIPYFFFCQDAKGHLRQLPRNALDEDILSADGATLKLDNKEMDGKECVFTNNTMDTKSLARRGHWRGGSYQSEKT